MQKMLALLNLCVCVFFKERESEMHSWRYEKLLKNWWMLYSKNTFSWIFFVQRNSVIYLYVEACLSVFFFFCYWSYRIVPDDTRLINVWIAVLDIQLDLEWAKNAFKEWYSKNTCIICIAYAIRPSYRSPHIWLKYSILNCVWFINWWIRRKCKGKFWQQKPKM